MPNTNFVWTDDLVHEFANKVTESFLNKYKSLPTLEDFKKSHEVKKDYEILSYINPNLITDIKDGNIHKPDQFAILRNYPTHSVKRLSDNQVFTIGEITNGGNKILKFSILNDNLIVKLATTGFENNSYFDTNIQSLTKKSKQPLFTTTDGKDIYEGDEYWGLRDWVPFKSNALRMFAGAIGTFSTEDAANEYVLMNKPCLSVNDVLDVSSTNETPTYKISVTTISIERLKELAKSKINV